MMSFAPTRPRRRPGENIVPMINVVFLLLIFFLMSARIAPPDPFEVTPPVSAAEQDASARDTLFVSARGILHFDGRTGAAALTAIAERDNQTPLSLRADATFPASDLAALLAQLAALGVRDTVLIAGTR